MKNIKLLLYFYTIIITGTICMYSQTGSVTYSADLIEEAKSNRMKKVSDEINFMEFTLKYNIEKSHFKLEKHIPIDERYAIPASIIMGAMADYFQSIKTKTVLYNRTIAGKTYQVYRSDEMTGWKLTNESSIINGYTCYKAILTQYNKRHENYYDTVAWYTPEIPVGYGPIGYGGLPGLILQLQYKKFIYNAKTITLNPKKIILEQIKDGKKISVDEFVRLMRTNRKVTED